MEKREPMVLIACGKKGVGKTVATVEMIYRYISGNPAAGVAPRKALIFDVNDEFSHFWYHGQMHTIKAIAIRDILRFTVHPKIEVRRIRPFTDDGKKMSVQDMQDTLGLILDNYRNGLLLVEDINKYTSDTIRADLVGSLATVRHIGIDLVAHYQSVGRAANPKLLGNTKVIRLHKTNDTVARHKNKFEERTEIMQIAESIVEKKFNDGDKRYYLYVDIDEGKIHGKFNKDDINYAIQDYAAKHHSALVKPLLTKIDLKTGKKIYTPQTALKQIIIDLQNKYFESKVTPTDIT
jgi:hypothetical protein